MKNTELIKDIKEAYVSINTDLSASALKEAITSVVRAINRLQTEDKDKNLLLRKISADLMTSYTNQVAYSELKHKSENPGLKVKPDFDPSFFKSLDILKIELFTLLEKI